MKLAHISHVRCGLSASLQSLAHSEQDAHQLVGQAKRRTTKTSDSAFSAAFSNFDRCRPEVADVVISSVAVEQVGLDVHAKVGHYTLNMGLIIRLVAGWSRFTHLHAVFNSSLQPTGSSWPRYIRHV